MSYKDKFIGRPGLRFQEYTQKKRLSLLNLNSFLEVLNIAEIGVGAGLITSQIAKTKHNYTGFEPDQELRNRLVNNFLSDKCNIREEPLPFINIESQFDIVILINVLEHSESHIEAKKWVSNVHKMLKPSGKLLTICPDYESFGKIFYSIDSTHGYVTSKERVIELVSGLNFSLKQFKFERAGSTNILIRLMASLGKAFFPYRLMDHVILKLTGIPLIGQGIMSGIFLRYAIWIFEKNP